MILYASDGIEMWWFYMLLMVLKCEILQLYIVNKLHEYLNGLNSILMCKIIIYCIFILNGISSDRIDEIQSQWNFN